MTVRRLAAITLIFVSTCVAWAVLGSSLIARTGQFDRRLQHDVEQLWGAPHSQRAPSAWADRPVTESRHVDSQDAQGRVSRQLVTQTGVQAIPAGLESTRATVDLALEQRQKGLLWYSTYMVRFKATYVFRNPDHEARTLRVKFPLPTENGLFDDFLIAINGQPSPLSGDISKEVTVATEIAGDAALTLDVHYASRGMGTWSYQFVETGVGQIRDFALSLHTNFRDVDFPAGTISPTAKLQDGGGWNLTWAFSNLISGQTIGMEMPVRLNPGPFAARITFFAPVSLLFFLTVMVMLGATYGPALHPMHYWFIAAAFFAFHLLLAYLVDHVSVHLAFALSAGVSLGLVASYLRAVTDVRGAVLRAVIAQGAFLVLFSYAFFFEGFTGLSITVGAILTLFFLMQMTARVQWDTMFGQGAAHASRL